MTNSVCNGDHLLGVGGDGDPERPISLVFETVQVRGGLSGSFLVDCLIGFVDIASDSSISNKFTYSLVI
jgi:hypothetical protein